MPCGVGRSSSRLSRASRRSVEPSHAICTFVRRLKPTRAACLSNSAVYGLRLSCSANGATACAWARSFSRVRWARSASSLPCSLDSRFFRLFSRLSRKLISFRSEEHTSELQSLRHLVCRLLLEKTSQHPLEFH